jgi:hypothetical protein
LGGGGNGGHRFVYCDLSNWAPAFAGVGRYGGDDSFAVVLAV